MDLQLAIRYIDRLKPWPWRLMVLVTIVSFIVASLFSVGIGYIMMSWTKHTSVVVRSQTEFKIPQISESIAKLTVDKILQRNIFNSEGLMGDKSEEGGEDKIPKTQLPIKVTGIIYSGDPLHGIAMIENTQKLGSVNSFMVGDVIPPDAKVAEIHQDQIIIENQGRREFAPLEEVELRRSTRKGGGKKKSNTPETLSGSGYALDAPPENYKEEGFERKGSNIELSSEYKNRLLSVDFANVLQDAKASPHLVDGVIKGWRMDRIRKNSFYEKAGIQNGDIVEEINGVVLSDAGQSIKLLNSLRNEAEIDLVANRNGQKMKFNIKVR